MLGYVMTKPGSLSLVTVPDPICRHDEVLLETEAVSICSTDVSYFRGHLFPDLWPAIPGHEYVGVVREVGADYNDVVRPGERITYWGQTDFGGMAELRTIRPLFASSESTETTWYTERNFVDSSHAAAVVVPPDMPALQATIVEPLTSVLRSLLGNPPRPGDSCVVLGCGPSAQLAIQVLKRHFGVGLVTAIDRNQARLQLAATLGADVVINSALGSTTLEDLGREHQDHYADYVFDALPHTFTEAPEVDVRKLAMGLLRPGGTYAIYGATGIPQLFSTWLILAKGLRVVATPFDVRLFPMRRTAHVARVALDLLRQRLIQAQPIVTAQLDFFNEHAVRSAFEHYGEGSAMKTSISRFGSITPYLDIDENRLSA